MLRAAESQNIGVRQRRIGQQPTNSKRATGTFEIVYPTEVDITLQQAQKTAAYNAKASNAAVFNI
jgi:hypothetical protein